MRGSANKSLGRMTRSTGTSRLQLGRHWRAPGYRSSRPFGASAPRLGRGIVEANVSSVGAANKRAAPGAAFSREVEATIPRVLETPERQRVLEQGARRLQSDIARAALVLWRTSVDERRRL
jgi:hypothetical protein